ncbi:beta-ketoacyl-[acyl-carrier-protein] synthase family protein [Rhodobacter sp. KR11]|uniref:beta-ketoacyl-[acyl-carrier-protein] synthase family protein n=1 Tax=Rhodobacter sp. KR11 TaxID=2974588 RepID=UPI0029CAAE81|nr:beta-ketoacyl-[acyl-carrier-protein] synthase family protein [Rhodobacter sp. KR11]
MITGAGAVTPLGDLAQTLAAMAEGRVAIGPLDLPDLDRLSIRIGAKAQVPDLDLGAWADPFATMAVASARAAVAGVDLDPGTGVILGSAGGGLQTTDDAYRAVYQAGRDRVHPFTVPRLMASAAPSLVARDLALTGPAFTVASACASSTHAIGLAFQMVRAGAPMMLAGGAEAMLTFGGIKAWEGLRVLSPTACRPFSMGRDGMVMGEGAGVFLLEDRAHALARGAQILAEITGFAMSAEAGDMVAPSAEGAQAVIRAALQDACLTPADIGHVNAHGTGTQANDRCEAAAIRAVFGDIPVTATKSLHGHLIGASGAVELLGVLLGLAGTIPVTAGFIGPDPAAPVDLVTTARRVSPRAVIKTSFAFGGLNAVLVLQPG